MPTKGGRRTSGDKDLRDCSSNRGRPIAPFRGMDAAGDSPRYMRRERLLLLGGVLAAIWLGECRQGDDRMDEPFAAMLQQR